MRIDEFHQGVAAYRRRSAVTFFVPMGMAFVWALAFVVPFGDAWRAFLSPRFGPVATELLWVLPSAVPLLLAFGSISPLSR